MSENALPGSSSIGAAWRSTHFGRGPCFHRDQRVHFQLLYTALVDGGLEFRGEVIRLVRTLRGGDRPKNAEKEFSGVTSMPRGCYEPWGIFRKPLGNRKVSDCLREFDDGRAAA